jgi:hypothetical protein
MGGLKGSIVLAAVASLAIGSAVPAEAAGARPNVFHTGAYYRALLLTRPPPYWMGGTVWVPLAPLLQPIIVVIQVVEPPSPPPPGPVWRRVPDAYLPFALYAPQRGPLWQKTANGFRLVADRYQ